MNRVVHFEFFSDDPESEVEFYRKVFGWDIQTWEGPIEYWLATTGQEEPGIDGAFGRPSAGGDQRVVNTMNVESVDDVVRSVKDAGGSVVTEKMPVPGVGWMAYLADPSGIIFGVMQDDPNAGLQ